MTPQEYCARLEAALWPMPPEERQEILRYYQEFLEDADEAERASLGTPEALAEKVLRENGIHRPPVQPMQSPSSPSPQKGNTAVKVILLILTSPIWLSLLIAFFAVIFSLLVCLIVIPLCLAVTLLAAVAFAILYGWKDIPYTLFIVGMGMICGGGAALLWRPIYLGGRALCKFTVLVVKKLFCTVFS